MELLVRVVDKAHPDDPVKHHQLTKAGDVIHYWPDGHDWGHEELTNPDWRVVRVPGLTEAEAEALVAAELPVVRGGVGQVLRKRGLRLDLAELDRRHGGAVLGRRRAHQAASFAPEELRKRHRHDCECDAAHVRELVAVKAPQPDPHTAGPFETHTAG